MIIAMDERDEGLPGVDPEQVRADMSLHGAAYVRARGDGTFERLDPASVRRPIQPGEPGYDDEHAGSAGVYVDLLWLP